MSWYNRPLFDRQPIAKSQAKLRLGGGIAVIIPIIMAISVPIYKIVHPGWVEQTEGETAYKIRHTIENNARSCVMHHAGSESTCAEKINPDSLCRTPDDWTQE